MHIIVLFCNNNNIKNIGTIPSKIRVLCCDNNEIETLGELPDTLKRLCCINNNIKAIEKIPNKLTEFYYDGNIGLEINWNFNDQML